MLSDILSRAMLIVINLSLLKVWIVCWLLYIFGSFVAWYWSWLGLIGVSLLWAIHDVVKNKK